MQISPIRHNFYRATAFKANYSKENNVAILGSSKTTDSLIDSLIKCSEITRYSVLSGKNIVTGCGSRGIMGQAYYTAVQFSKKDKDGKPEQNLVVLKDPLWGDEDLKNCKVLGVEKTEAARIEKFIETADSFVIFPGGPGTLQEASTLISNNYYNKGNKKRVFLVGKEYFRNLDEQYKKMQESGLIKCHRRELYTLTDDPYKVLEEMNCL